MGKKINIVRIMFSFFRAKIGKFGNSRVWDFIKLVYYMNRIL